MIVITKGLLMVAAGSLGIVISMVSLLVINRSMNRKRKQLLMRMEKE